MFIDYVWMIIQKRGEKIEVAYEVGASAKEVWDKIIQHETLGSGHTKKSLNKEGWRAKRVRILITKGDM